MIINAKSFKVEIKKFNLCEIKNSKDIVNPSLEQDHVSDKTDDINRLNPLKLTQNNIFNNYTKKKLINKKYEEKLPQFIFSYIYKL